MTTGMWFEERALRFHFSGNARVFVPGLIINFNVRHGCVFEKKGISCFKSGGGVDFDGATGGFGNPTLKRMEKSVLNYGRRTVWI